MSLRLSTLAIVLLFAVQARDAALVDLAPSGTLPAGLRILDGHFIVIRQAMDLPKARPAGAKYLPAFVEDMKATGFVAASLTRDGIEGAIVAPAGR